VAETFKYSLEKYNKRLAACVALRLWERQLQLGKTVTLNERSAAGMKVPELIDVVEEAMIDMLRRGNVVRRIRASDQPKSKWAEFAARRRARQLKPFKDGLRRYLKLYRPELMEELGDE